MGPCESRFAPPPDPHPAKEGTAALYSHRVLEELATETSDAERRAATAERELRDWKTAQFMEAASWRRIRGLIISVQNRMFCGIAGSFCGRLASHRSHRRSGGNALHVSRARHSIVAGNSFSQRKGRGAVPQKAKQSSWKLGDRVRVRAERIDPMRHRVEFALV